MGLYLLDKPSGISSNKALTAFKRENNISKAGFSGVLDPFATGLLVIATDSHTKLLDFFLKQNKTYTGTILFGKTTDTLDTEGEILEEVSNVSLSKEQIEDMIREKFIGDIKQIPPAYSNIKVDGKRARELALQGKEVKLKPKDRHIFTFKITDYDNCKAKFEVEVSSGTYIRSLAFDLGKELGYPAMLTELRRTKIGIYEASNAEVDPYNGLGLEIIEVNEQTAEVILNGKDVSIENTNEDIIVISKDYDFWMKRNNNGYKIYKRLR